MGVFLSRVRADPSTPTFPQLLQHTVLGDCDSRINQFLTALAWLHVAFQPAVVNQSFLHLTHPAVASLVSRLSWLVGILLALRLPFPGNPVAALGTWLNGTGPAGASRGLFSLANPPLFDPSTARFPDIPPAWTAGRACAVGDAMCGQRLCVFQGSRHLAWSVPLLPSSYFLPGPFAHFLLFFGPALLLPGPDAGPRRVTAAVCLLLGPLLSMTAARGASYALEWPAIWCLMSSAQAFLIPVGDAVEAHLQNKAAAAGPRGALHSSSPRAAGKEPLLTGAPITPSRVV